VTRERLSRAAYLRAVDDPRRRYAALSVTKGSLALRGAVPTPAFWFERQDVVGDQDGRYWRERDSPVVTLVIDGWPAVLFYVTAHRLDSCTFAYNLTPTRLVVTAAVMRKARLGRYIRRAAEWALKNVPQSNPALTPALRTLLGRERS
jgi:hypothetical protein